MRDGGSDWITGSIVILYYLAIIHLYRDIFSSELCKSSLVFPLSIAYLPLLRILEYPVLLK